MWHGNILKQKAEQVPFNASELFKAPSGIRLQSQHVELSAVKHKNKILFYAEEETL